MTNEALAVSGTQTISATPKRKGGRPSNPNAMKIRAPQLLGQGYPYFDHRTRL
jgi:hypothetical protein